MILLYIKISDWIRFQWRRLFPAPAETCGDDPASKEALQGLSAALDSTDNSLQQIREMLQSGVLNQILANAPHESAKFLAALQAKDVEKRSASAAATAVDTARPCPWNSSKFN